MTDFTQIVSILFIVQGAHTLCEELSPRWDLGLSPNGATALWIVRERNRTKGLCNIS